LNNRCGSVPTRVTSFRTTGPVWRIRCSCNLAAACSSFAIKRIALTTATSPSHPLSIWITSIKRAHRRIPQRTHTTRT